MRPSCARPPPNSCGALPRCKHRCAASSRHANPSMSTRSVRKARNAMAEIAVMGAGSWGTAFSLVLADAGNAVRIWARRQDVCHSLNHEHVNAEYLPGVLPPEQITSTDDAAHATGCADI